ncbi:hypothetical protein MRX96_006496 [Rhipicephalus microplus]
MMAVACSEVKGVSVPTLAEKRRAMHLARRAVTPAQNQEEVDAKAHGEVKPEEAEHGKELNGAWPTPKRADNRKAPFCEHELSDALHKSEDSAGFAIVAATKTAAAGKKDKEHAGKSSPTTATSTSSVSPMSAGKSASVVLEVENVTVNSHDGNQPRAEDPVFTGKVECVAATPIAPLA